MIGNELQRARLDAGMTQEELALKAQIDRSYVSLLENNKKSPTIEMLFRICEVLGVKVSTLVARVERNSN
jgi:transcriptional regulator with XRE-family HTH domain